MHSKCLKWIQAGEESKKVSFCPPKEAHESNTIKLFAIGPAQTGVRWDEQT